MDDARPIALQLLSGSVFGLKGQLGILGPCNALAYEAWVYGPRSATPPILLGGPLEHFTRTSPLAALAVWLPVILFCLTPAPALGALSSLLLLACGVVMWSLMEYCFHRFIFHHRPSTNLGCCIHFLLHGVHHRFPLDRLRLLFPPPIGLAVLYLAYSTLSCLMPPPCACVIVAGGAAGFLFYDLVHYALHHLHAPPTNPLFRAFLRYQGLHKRHHIDHVHTFGVSPLGAVWDSAWGTAAPGPGLAIK